ncbi:hypothetical protein [Streptomyces sp. NPDC088923]|uniref:DUF7848 domain-containing protein n=1 Tax=Streptomyces sp. NPDC088923 TaxID=3365913 RepID=UPI0037F976A1
MRSIGHGITYVTSAAPGRAMTWDVICVTSEGEECGARSREVNDEAEGVLWMVNHTAWTGHTRFERRRKDYAVVEPFLRDSTS